MLDWLQSIEGTETGALVATFLALLSAVAHASFGALQKGRFDPWIMRGTIDFFYAAMALPVALFLVPAPDFQLMLVLVGAWAVHTGYKIFQAMAYSRGGYTVVYPVARGTGPLFTAAAAGLVFGETLRSGQWLGIFILSAAIFGLAFRNYKWADAETRKQVGPAMLLAVVTGFFIAFYTVYDAWGIRQPQNPFTFLVWFFVIDGWTFPLISWWRNRKTGFPSAKRALLIRGFIGALIAYVSFGAILMATRIGEVGKVAALRETSTVFAALIGWLFLRETVGPVRAILMAIIALGAVIVEIG